MVRQGYLACGGAASVRIRVIGAEGFLTVKSNEAGRVRMEYEYAIPAAEAEAMLAHLCVCVLSKRRHAVAWNGADWIVDEFEGDLEGLVLAEIELASVDQHVEAPPWTGREVTDDGSFRNEALARAGLPKGDGTAS
jgi:adenylate cyclase